MDRASKWNVLTVCVSCLYLHGVIAGGKHKLGLAHTFIAAHFVKLNVEHRLLIW